jgi:hypothetical protein
MMPHSIVPHLLQSPLPCRKRRRADEDSPKIAVEMFWTFVRFEYALKAVGAHRCSCGALQRLFC